MFKIALLHRAVSISSPRINGQNIINTTLLYRPNADLIDIRYLAKGKDKRKEDKGKGVKKNIEINEDYLGQIINLEKLKTEMDRNLLKLSENYLKFVNVRNLVGSIESISVHLDGKKYPLIELAQIIRNNPKIVIINMAAFPQALPATLKALLESGMNLNPQQDGTAVYVPIPKVTREHRENLSKNAKIHFIKCRDGIRDVQNKYLKSIKSKEKDDIPEDDRRRLSEQLVFLGDNYVMKAQKMLEDKQKELLGN